MGNLFSELFHPCPLEEDKKSGGGPLGLGDPEDQTLRPFELQIYVPRVIERKIEKIKCKALWEEVEDCTFNTFFSIYYCKDITEAFNACARSYETEEFKQETKDEYLKYRSLYRRTGRRRLFNALQGKDTFPPLDS